MKDAKRLVQIEKRLGKRALGMSGHIPALFVSGGYSDATGQTIKAASDLDALDYRDDFEHHRKNYYKAELVCRETRDAIRPDEASPIEALKDEVEEGIYETRRRSYTDAVHKVDAVMEQASKVPISSWVDDATFRWIGPAEKKGVCHILVNDERFKWVDVI